MPLMMCKRSWEFSQKVVGGVELVECANNVELVLSKQQFQYQSIRI